MSYVGPSGPRYANIAIIGEAPGKEELLQGKPFVGASGKFLDAVLLKNGIKEVYKTNLIKQFAPAAPLLSLSEADLLMWREILRAELETVSANVLCPTGNTALWALVNDTVRVGYSRSGQRIIENGISNWRGSTLSAYNGRKVIPSYHPAYVLRDPSEKDTFIKDIQKLVIESFSPEISLPENIYYTKPSLSEALDYLNQCRLSGKFAFDIETAQGICTCIGFSYDPSHAMCIPLQGHNYWRADEFMILLTALNETLSSNAVKIGQNVSYDIIGLQAMGIFVKPPIEDIMLIHHAIDPLAQHSLAFQASMFTNHPFWKEWDIAPIASGNVTNLYSYNCKDSFITLELEQKYQKLYPQRVKFYESFYKPLQPILIQMYFDGICQNFDKKSQLSSEFRQKGNEFSQLIADGLGVKSFNLNSPKAVMHVLYDILELPIQKKKQFRGPWVPTVDDDALVNLYLQTQNPFVLLIRDAKEQLKLASFLDPASKSARSKRRSWDDRLRCEYSQNTKTGRLRAFASLTTGIGINLQQIPKIVRQVYIPAPGYIFLEPDYQQAEARAIAWDGIDIDTMNFFELARKEPEKYDIHWRNAEIMMNLARSELSKNDRQIAKPIGFGSWYGMTPQGIQRNILKQTDPPLFVEVNECRHRQDLFKLNAPNCFQRQDRVRDEVFSTGQQISPTGQVWIYHEIVIDELKYCFGRRDYNEILREMYSAIPQNTVAYLTARSIVQIDSFLRLNNLGRVVLQVHDSILLEIKDDIDSIMKSFREAKHVLEEPFVIRNNEMIIPVDFKLGYNWLGEVEGIKNEDQLREAYEKVKR